MEWFNNRRRCLSLVLPNIFQPFPRSSKPIIVLLHRFAWIMGVGIAIKIKFDKRNSIPTKDLVFQCLRRSLTLIILGLIISNLHANDLTHYRYFGVLQRLGLAYCFVTLLEIVFMEPQSPQVFYLIHISL